MQVTASSSGPCRLQVAAGFFWDVGLSSLKPASAAHDEDCSDADEQEVSAKVKSPKRHPYNLRTTDQTFVKCYKSIYLGLFFPSILASVYLPAEEVSLWARAGEEGSREGPGAEGNRADGSEPAASGCCCIWASALSLTQQLTALAPVHGSSPAGHSDRASPRCGWEGPKDHLLQVIQRLNA